MKRVALETALDNALFGVDWDASVCQQRLAAMAACTADDPQRSHHLRCAIDALQGAKASLAVADRLAARLTGGRR